MASKFGVLGLTKNSALEYAGTHLRINAVSPGFTRSPMIVHDNSDEINYRRWQKSTRLDNLQCRKRSLKPFYGFVSESSTFAVGMNLLVDGDYTLQ